MRSLSLSLSLSAPPIALRPRTVLRGKPLCRPIPAATGKSLPRLQQAGAGDPQWLPAPTLWTGDLSRPLALQRNSPETARPFLHSCFLVEGSFSPGSSCPRSLRSALPSQRERELPFFPSVRLIDAGADAVRLVVSSARFFPLSFNSRALLLQEDRGPVPSSESSFRTEQSEGSSLKRGRKRTGRFSLPFESEEKKGCFHLVVFSTRDGRRRTRCCGVPRFLGVPAAAPALRARRGHDGPRQRRRRLLLAHPR